MNWIFYKIHLLLHTRLSWATALAEQRSQGRRFCCFCFELDVILFYLFWARCCPPLLSAVAAHPVVPYSTHLHRWSTLTGAKQHCFGTCRELVKRRWVWNRGKGQRPKTSPCTSSCSHTLWHRSHAAWTLKQVVKPPPTERANLLWNVFFYF